jgi:hypothetical protein
MRAPMGLMLGLVGALALASCQNLGPSSIEQDRVDYAGAMADSWKQQMLLNIVKFRDFDTPVFLDVSSMISSYQIEGQVNVAASLLPKATSSSGRTGSATNNTSLDTVMGPAPSER